MTPQRLLDTRTYHQQIGANQGIGLGIPDTVPANATAVVLDLAGTGSTAPTFLAIRPEGQPGIAPSSNLNLAAGETRANLVTVALGDHGVLVLAGPAAVDAIVDLEGYYAPGSGDGFTPMSPSRVLDTRSSAPVGQNGTYVLDLSPSVPAGATAAVFNLTGLDASASTFVTAYADGTSLPLASNLNLVPGAITPNLVTVPISADRKVDLHNAYGSVDLVADLAGYYAAGSGQSFYPFAPARVLDTREANGNSVSPIGQYQTKVLDLSPWLPPTATSTVINLTGTNVTASTVVTAYPDGSGVPLASNLNLVAGQTSANLAMVALPQNNPKIDLHNLNGQVDLVADVAGYFAPALAPCTSGCVSSFGTNLYGAFGNGVTSVSVQGATPGYGLSGATAVDSNGNTTYALRSDGTVWASGINLGGALGNGSGPFVYNFGIPSTAYPYSTLPVQVSGLTNVVAISNMMALKSDGTVWTWGDNSMWVLGDGSTNENDVATTPVQVSGLTDVAAIVAGPDTRYALKKDGTVWTWGDNIQGQLGNGISGTDACVNDAGDGEGTNGPNCASAVPVQVQGLTGVTAIGPDLAAKSDGTVWRWGPHGNAVPQQQDDPPVLFPGLTNVTALVANGYGANYALLADGTVRAWGETYDDQLGDGAPCTSQNWDDCYTDTPVTVSGLSSVTAITGGDTAGYALKSDGTMWAWGGGNGGGGALGVGNPTGQSTVPVQVPNLSGVTAIGDNGVAIS